MNSSDSANFWNGTLNFLLLKIRILTGSQACLFGPKLSFWAVEIQSKLQACQNSRTVENRPTQFYRLQSYYFHQNLNISLTTNLGLVVYYFISTEFTERSAAPQTAPWRDTWPRFEPRTGLALSVLNQLHNSLPPAPESADDESDHVVAGRGDNRHQGSHADHHQSYHSIRFKSEISQHECITKINV